MLNQDNLENKSAEPVAENKQDDGQPGEAQAGVHAEGEVTEPEAAEAEDAKPGLTVDAQQWPPPGSFAATGTASPDNEDPSWYSAERSSWEPPPSQ